MINRYNIEKPRQSSFVRSPVLRPGLCAREAEGRRTLLINLPYMQLKKLNNYINNLSRTLKWLGSSLKPLEDVLQKKIELWVILRAITSHLIAAQASRVRDRDVARVLNYETNTRQ
jgi:hypothetical protein